MADLNWMANMVLTYEDKELQSKALSAVPIREITEKASRQLRDQQREARDLKRNIEESELYERFYLNELVSWFKNEYFTWVDVRNCKDCNIDMVFIRKYNKFGTTKSPHPYTVEVYECSMCGLNAEFPRYNDAHMLLITKEGRCSEWAQVFTLIVRALGWRARYVYDVTDHEWTEVWSALSKRWIHVDPCEGLVDSPLVYELGWGKELTFVLAVSCDDVQDVTWRYSSNHKSLLARRLPHLEKKYLNSILEIRKRLLANKSPNKRLYILKEVISELAELMIEPKANGQYLGRISGSQAWREARSELGAQSRKGYVWCPLKNEVEQMELVVRYCTSKDIYVRDERGDEGIFFGWNNYTFNSSNIFRKEEKDWKMAYLAKKDENRNGIISWKFDLSESRMLIKTVKIKCHCFVINEGTVRIELESDGFPMIKMENVDYFESSTFENCSTFTMTAYLGDDLKSNWQHSQLFRQPLDSLEFPLIIKLILKPQ
ncbi:hypothetical protein O3M35_003925 [Rhynocoris fuscipes]|uniref:Peptide-N(4)-(N-acetyl-beta-glucosaminyl)asparagine amidase n=1 Tax=Rhynocoris fuscipes TaxID=488301 RepID=A0AAW1CKP5_9HEMI